MISFRFHIVSIVAVFLALAIGIVVGSTVIDQTIVDTLRDRVDDVNDNLDARQQANDLLSEQLDDIRQFTDESAGFAVNGRLKNMVAVVVTDRGVDRGPVDRTIELLGEAGASVRGVLTVQSAWDLDDEDRRIALAEAIGAEPDEAADTLQDRAASLLVTDLASSVEVVDDGTGALDEITELQLVDFEVMDDVVAPRPNRVLFVIVSGPETDLVSSAHTEAFATAAAGAVGGVVLAEVYAERDNGPERADSLSAVLGDPSLMAQISTVDDLDLAFGPLTAIYALAADQAGDVGHYGLADGAELTAPPAPAGP